MAVATQIEQPTLIVQRIVSESVAIPKGTMLKMTGDNTGAASAANSDPFAGITIEEFTGGENLTHVACAMDGVFDIDTTAAAIAAGETVSIGGANSVAVSVGTADLIAGSQVGQAETARTGSNRIRVRVGR